MADDSERVYTIPLGKVLLSPDNRRAMRAINMIREFARRHMKIQEIKIDQTLSHEIWARGIKSPPRKVRVRMSKTEDGHVLVSPYSLGPGVDADTEEAVEDSKKADAASDVGAPGDDAADDGPGEPVPEADAADADTPEKDQVDDAPEAPKADAPEPKADAPEPKAAKPKPKADVPKPKADAPEPKAAKPKPKADASGKKPKGDKADAPKADAAKKKPKADKPKSAE